MNTTEGTGGAGFYYDYGSFQELQLTGDGNDASAATPGVQLNAVVKSGGNKFKGDFYYDYENKDFQGNNVTDELRRVGVTEGTRILLYRDPNVEPRRPDQARQAVVLHVVPRSAHGRHRRRVPGREARRVLLRDAADEHHLQDQLSALAEQPARPLHSVGPEVPAASRRGQHGVLRRAVPAGQLVVGGQPRLERRRSAASSSTTPATRRSATTGRTTRTASTARSTATCAAG